MKKTEKEKLLSRYKGPKFLELDTWLGHAGDRVVSMHAKYRTVAHGIPTLLPLCPATA